VTFIRTEPDEGPATSRPFGDSGPEPSPAPDDLTERVVARNVLHRGRYLEFRIDTIERADGSRSTRDIVGHPGAVAILAIDDHDRVLLVRQYRIAAGEALLEIPAGTLDVDPITGRTEEPDRAAARELEEETGYRARSWRHVAGFWSAPGFATEFMHLYLATDLVPAHENRLGPDEDEHLQLERLPRAEAIAAAERGELRDAKSLVGLLWLARQTDGSRAAPSRTGMPGERRIVEAEFVLGMSDVLAANMALWRGSRALMTTAAVIFGVGVVLLLSGRLLLALPALVIGLATLFGVAAVPFVWFRLRGLPDVFDRTSAISADDVGVRYDSPFGNGIYRWAAFKRVREHDGFVFFETGVGPGLFVPLSAFSPEALLHLRRLLLAAGFAPNRRLSDRR
jgi:ADP-ribose pyrophosphatase